MNAWFESVAMASNEVAVGKKEKGYTMDRERERRG